MPHKSVDVGVIEVDRTRYPRHPAVVRELPNAVAIPEIREAPIGQPNARIPCRNPFVAGIEHGADKIALPPTLTCIHARFVASRLDLGAKRLSDGKKIRSERARILHIKVDRKLHHRRAETRLRKQSEHMVGFALSHGDILRIGVKVHAEGDIVIHAAPDVGYPLFVILIGVVIAVPTANNNEIDPGCLDLRPVDIPLMLAYIDAFRSIGSGVIAVRELVEAVEHSVAVRSGDNAARLGATIGGRTVLARHKLPVNEPPAVRHLRLFFDAFALLCNRITTSLQPFPQRYFCRLVRDLLRL